MFDYNADTSRVPRLCWNAPMIGSTRTSIKKALTVRSNVQWRPNTIDLPGFDYPLLDRNIESTMNLTDFNDVCAFRIFVSDSDTFDTTEKLLKRI